MGHRHYDLLHEESRDSDQNAYETSQKPEVPVESSRCLLYPLLVHCAVSGQIVEDFVLQHIVMPAMLVSMGSMHDRRLIVLHATHSNARQGAVKY